MNASTHQRDALASLALISRVPRDKPQSASQSALRARVGQVMPAENLGVPAYAGAGLLLALAGAAVGGYHGYLRDRGDLPWTLIWGAAGFFFPVTTAAVAIGQGYGSKL